MLNNSVSEQGGWSKGPLMVASISKVDPSDIVGSMAPGPSAPHASETTIVDFESVNGLKHISGEQKCFHASSSTILVATPSMEPAPPTKEIPKTSLAPL